MTDDSAPLRDDNRTSFGGGEVFQSGAQTGGAPPAVDAYATLITELLAAAESRAKALEGRAIAVVTTSGTLVTLLLALAALVTRTQTFRVPEDAVTVAALAAFAFVVAAAAALLANLPLKRWGVLPDLVRSELWERWDDAGDRPLEKVTATRLAIWESVHGQTQLKAQAVFWAIVAQALAVALLTVAVAIILL